MLGLWPWEILGLQGIVSVQLLFGCAGVHKVMGHLAIATLAEGFQDLDLLPSDCPALEVGDAWQIQHPSCRQHNATQSGSMDGKCQAALNKAGGYTRPHVSEAVVLRATSWKPQVLYAYGLYNEGRAVGGTSILQSMSFLGTAIKPKATFRDWY